jgi:glycosidase
LRAVPRVPVRIELELAPRQPLLLVGDFPSWKRPVQMVEVAPGRYRADLELEPGLYRYRFRIGLTGWISDPNPKARDLAEGHDNALLIVGGTVPPLYFAPDRRHLAVFPDGRVLLHAEVDAGAPIPPHVWLAADGAERLELPIEVGRARGGRVPLSARGRLPPGASASFGFAGTPAHVFMLPPPIPASERPPDWLDGAVLYGIFVDRWRRSKRSPPDPRASSRSQASGPRVFYGGDLLGIAESLDELARLGVSAIVLTPVHKSESPHRYDPTDLQTIDPRLGGESALEQLVAAAHARGLRVIADVSVTHVHMYHRAFQSLIAESERSPYRSWFKVRRLPLRAGDRETYEFYYDRPDLPLLDLSAPEPRRHAIDAALQLVRLGVDGLRLDAMDDAPPSFWQQLRREVRKEKPDLLLLGEVVGDRPSRYSESLGIDVATDFEHREAMIAFFAKGAIDAEEFERRVAFSQHRRGPFDPSARLSFLDNHDTARFLSLAGRAKLHLALTYLFFRPEPVSLTYGVEHDLAAGKDLGIRLDDAWPERLPLPDGALEETSTGRLIRELAKIRSKLYGPVREVVASGPLLILERSTERGSVRAAFNLSDHAIRDRSLSGSTLLSVGDVDPESVREGLPPLSARLLQVDSGDHAP